AVLAARETAVATAATPQPAKRQRWVAVARTRAKAATRSDSLRAEIDVRSAQLAVLEAATASASADAALARAIGSLEPVTAAATDSIEPGLGLDDQSLAAMIEEAPSVHSARAHLKADREAQKGSWTTYLPSVSASWTHTGSGQVGPGFWGPNSLDYSGALRLSLNFTLFDQFRRESQVIQAGTAVRVAEAELRDARLAARQQLVDGLGVYRAARQRAAALAARGRGAGGGPPRAERTLRAGRLDAARRAVLAGAARSGAPRPDSRPLRPTCGQSAARGADRTGSVTRRLDRRGKGGRRELSFEDGACAAAD